MFFSDDGRITVPKRDIQKKVKAQKINSYVAYTTEN